MSTTQRERYIDGEITHDEYYGMLVAAKGEAAVRLGIPFSLEQIRKALDNGDYRLNTLPLERWDRMHEYVAGIPVNRERWKSLTGSFGSALSDTVCMLKCAARRWASENP